MSKSLKQLQNQWYRKLSKTGFKDIEKDGVLKEFHSLKFQNQYSPQEFLHNQRYWQLAQQLLHDYPFLNNREKRMWEMYVQGKNFRLIAKATRSSYATVQRTLSRIGKVIKL